VAEVTEEKPATGNKRQQTTEEEIANAITHGLGALFGLCALVAMLWVAIVSRGSALLIASLAIYGTSLFLLYMASTLYHALTHRTAKKVFQVFDHSTIYLLIAGTYTPVCLIAVGGPAGWTLFIAEWVLAAGGITMEATWPQRPRWLNATIYIIMGWLAVLAMRPIVQNMPPTGIWLIVAGGISYTFGVIFYAMHGVKWMHSIWHLFVLLGSVLQFVAVIMYIAPKG
jgi:hemolysin III